MTTLQLTSDNLAKYEQFQKPDISQIYEISDALHKAIEVAIVLNQPLIITGEPGTGKTTLADKVAHDLHKITNGKYRRKPYRFNTKSNTVYSDLFYTYDAVRHFYDVHIKKEQDPDISKYIELNALGSAIVASRNNGKEPDPAAVPARNANLEGEAPNSVVLIDEIDKAPRDFPNDLLNELENYCFQIKEAGSTVYEKNKNGHILIILTSNGERELPEAFLRRCVFHYIPFPDDTMLMSILMKHAFYEKLNSRINIILQRFAELRGLCRNKKPATAELVSWCYIIAEKNIDPNNVLELIETLPVVVKHNSDLVLVTEKWRNAGI